MRNRRILTAQFIAISRYESLNKCTRARFCYRLEVGSPILAFRFPLCVSIVNLKNTTPSGDIPREHYRQHCQYRLRGLRYRREHITPVLFALHRLPIRHRIQLKLLLLVYRCIHQLAPDYLMDLVVPYVLARSLRSAIC